MLVPVLVPDLNQFADPVCLDKPAHLYVFSCLPCRSSEGKKRQRQAGPAPLVPILDMPQPPPPMPLMPLPPSHFLPQYQPQPQPSLPHHFLAQYQHPTPPSNYNQFPAQSACHYQHAPQLSCPLQGRVASGPAGSHAAPHADCGRGWLGQQGGGGLEQQAESWAGAQHGKGRANTPPSPHLPGALLDECAVNMEHGDPVDEHVSNVGGSCSLGLLGAGQLDEDVLIFGDKPGSLHEGLLGFGSRSEGGYGLPDFGDQESGGRLDESLGDEGGKGGWQLAQLSAQPPVPTTSGQQADVLTRLMSNLAVTSPQGELKYLPRLSRVR